MPEIWGIAENETYVANCSGQTTYIYRKDGSPVAQLKGQRYAYWPLFTPDGNLWIKASTGHMYVYSANDFSLIKRWKETKYDSQDGNHILSWDNRHVIDVLHEDGRPERESRAIVRRYAIDTLSFTEQNVEGLPHLGITRYDDGRHYLLLDYDKLSLMDETGVTESKPLPKREDLRLSSIISLQCYGCTETAYRWSDFAYAPGNEKMTPDEIRRFSLSDYYRRLPAETL